MADRQLKYFCINASCKYMYLDFFLFKISGFLLINSFFLFNTREKLCVCLITFKSVNVIGKMKRKQL